MHKPTISWDSSETGELKWFEFPDDAAMWAAARDMAFIANSATPPLGKTTWTLRDSSGGVTTITAGREIEGGGDA